MAISAIPANGHAIPRPAAGLQRSAAPATSGQASGAGNSASFDNVMNAANAAASQPKADARPADPEAPNGKVKPAVRKSEDHSAQKAQDSKAAVAPVVVPNQQPAAPDPNQPAPANSEGTPAVSQSSADGLQPGTATLLAVGLQGTQDGNPAIGDSSQTQAAPAAPAKQADAEPPASQAGQAQAAEASELALLAKALQNGGTLVADSAQPAASPAQNNTSAPATAATRQSSAAQASSTVSQQPGAQTAGSHSVLSQSSTQTSSQPAAGPDAIQLLKNANINPHMMQVVTDLKASGSGSTLLPQSGGADAKTSAPAKPQDAGNTNGQKDQPASNSPSAVTPAPNAAVTARAVAADAGHAGDGSGGKQNGGSANASASSASVGQATQDGSQAASFAAALAGHSTDSGAGAQPASAPAAQAPAPGTAAALAGLGAAYAPAGRVVNAASLLQNGGQVEMRVEMHTDTLGALELRTVLQGGKIGAAINVQNPDAHTLLASELPALHQALSNHNLHVENVSISSNGAGGRQAGAQSNSGWRPGHQGPAATWQSGQNIESASVPEAEHYEPEIHPGRLSVRA